jgi:hypothetical protein
MHDCIELKHQLLSIDLPLRKLLYGGVLIQLESKLKGIKIGKNGGYVGPWTFSHDLKQCWKLAAAKRFFGRLADLADRPMANGQN